MKPLGQKRSRAGPGAAHVPPGSSPPFTLRIHQSRVTPVGSRDLAFKPLEQAPHT